MGKEAADDQVRFERDYRLDAEGFCGKAADLAYRFGFRRVITVCGDAYDSLSRTRGEQDLGEFRRQRHDARCLARQLYRGAAFVGEADAALRPRGGNCNAGQRDRRGED